MGYLCQSTGRVEGEVCRCRPAPLKAVKPATCRDHLIGLFPKTGGKQASQAIRSCCTIRSEPCPPLPVPSGHPPLVPDWIDRHLKEASVIEFATTGSSILALPHKWNRVSNRLFVTANSRQPTDRKGRCR